MTARALELPWHLRLSYLASALFAFILLFAAPSAFAQGSGLDYMNKASFDEARTQEQTIGKLVNNGERHKHKAEKIQRKAGGGAELDAKARAEYERAASDFEKALGKDPTLIEARFLLGQVYAQLGEFEKALSSCHQAWSMNAQLFEAAICEANASLGLSRPRNAQEIFLTLKEKHNESAATVLSALKAWSESHPDHTSAAPLKTWLTAQTAASK